MLGVLIRGSHRISTTISLRSTLAIMTGWARVSGGYRGVVQLGRAPALGAGSRWFESSLPDHHLSHSSFTLSSTSLIPLPQPKAATRRRGKDRTTKVKLIDSIKGAFSSAGWNYSSPEHQDVIECQFEAHHCRVALHAQAYEEFGAISIVASPNVEVATDRLAKGAELLMRSNLKLNIGNLEMDWATGKVFFRATNLFPDPAALGEIPRSLVHSAIAEVDRIAPQITILNRDISPSAALLDIEELMEREDLLPPSS